MKEATPIEGYITVPGGRVWYRAVGSGDGVPLLTLHGGPGFLSDYLAPLAGLGDERRVIFYDQLGGGKSDRPDDASLWRLERFVEELAAVRDQLNLDRVHVFGQSWGSTLAAEFALGQPSGLAGLILADPVISWPRYALDAAKLRAALPPEVRQVLDRCEAAGATDSEEYQAASMEFYRRHVCRLDPWPDMLMEGLAQLNEAVYGTMQGPNEFSITGNMKDYDATGRLREIQVPTLFLCGRYDETTPESTAWYHSLLPGSEMVIFEESAHLPHLEETHRFLEVVRDFLRRADAQ